jgi:hypothetical protein
MAVFVNGLCFYTLPWTLPLSPRPNSTVEDTVVALEVLSLPQAHDTQCGTNGPFARGEDRSG